MLVPTLLRRDRIPQHSLGRLGDRTSVEVGEVDTGARDDRHLLVTEEDDVARVTEDGRDIRGDEELVLAQADDDRRAVSNRHDLLGVLDGHEHKGEHAAHQFQGAANRVLEAVRLASRARRGARRSPCRFLS